MPLKAVLFDLWGTLVLDPPDRSLPRMGWRAVAVQQALKDHGFVADVDKLTAVLSATARELGKMQDLGIDLVAGGRARLFAGLYEQSEGTRPPESALADVEEAIGMMPAEYRPIEAPGACDVLKAVKDWGLPVGLVSNAGLTTSPHLLGMMEFYGMVPHFDSLVFSDDIGIAKPDARIFAECLDALKLQADECAYVGDSPHNDIWGAQQLGMIAIHVGRRQQEGITPNFHIDSLSELLPVLQTLERAAGSVRG